MNKVFYALGIFVLFFMVFTTVARADEGCDSATNSNCIETNSNTNSTTNSNITSTTTVKSPPPPCDSANSNCIETNCKSPSAMAPSINSSTQIPVIFLWQELYRHRSLVLVAARQCEI